MAKPTRAEVIGRANNYWPQSGYYFGGSGYYYATTNNGYYDYGSGIASYRVRFNSSYGLPWLDNSGPYMAVDCSAFCSMCWLLSGRYSSKAWSPTGKFGGSRFRYRHEGSTMEEIYPGIQQGDVLYRPGHVALYYGNNQVIELYMSNWPKSQNGHGGAIRTRTDFDGYCSYDGTFSDNYDHDDPDLPPITDWEGDNPHVEEPEVFPPSPTGDEIATYLIADRQYTKKYINMKPYRRL